MMNNIFDTHAHYDDDKFLEDRDEVIASLEKSGVCGIVNASVDIKTSHTVLDYTKKYHKTFINISNYTSIY